MRGNKASASLCASAYRHLKRRRLLFAVLLLSAGASSVAHHAPSFIHASASELGSTTRFTTAYVLQACGSVRCFGLRVRQYLLLKLCQVCPSRTRDGREESKGKKCEWV
ncbi:hypothetical protein B0H16DRAFT_281463 [Mycena metata]|uniref:Secreted protein n=1 Tax=Mycena metata TaxID=1033252 RepID=A0AAD7MNC4_9AGAR|nr:hypothetical protein B0H16DRAFT_281463 [Mycena metata]